MGKNLSRSAKKKLAETKKLYRRFVMSFGAINTMFKFLPSYEVLKMQALSRWLYDLGVGRCQLKWPLFGPYLYFAATNEINIGEMKFVYRYNVHSSDLAMFLPDDFA